MISRLDSPSLSRRSTYRRVFGVAGHSGHDDAPEGCVGLPVAAAVQPMAGVDFAAGGRYRRGAAEPGEAGLAA